MTWFCIIFVSPPPPAVYEHAKFKVSNFSHFWDMLSVHNWQLSLAPLWSDQDARLTQFFKGPQECLPQPASVQPFLHNEAELIRVTDRLADWQTDGQTPRSSATIVCISCIRHSLIMNIWYSASLRGNLITEALRCGTRCRRISQFYLPPTHLFTN